MLIVIQLVIKCFFPISYGCHVNKRAGCAMDREFGHLCLWHQYDEIAD